MNVTLETLHLVFSAFGYVQKIATFEKGQGFQALVQYADAETAEQVQRHKPFPRVALQCSGHLNCCDSPRAVHAFDGTDLLDMFMVLSETLFVMIVNHCACQKYGSCTKPRRTFLVSSLHTP